ncbi:MAG: hypothetical protein HZR80_12280 [Candidatus Heimdallarchaeota archaeon]
MIRGYDSERLPFEPPTLDYYRNYWDLPKPSGQETITVFAFNDFDELIGFGYSGWNIKYDNLDHGFFQIYVVATNRRKGFGTKIIRKLFSQIPSQIKTLAASTKEGSIGEAFLQKFKHESCFEELFRAADLSEFNLEEIREIVKIETERIEQLGYTFVELESLDYAEKFNEEEYVRMVERIWNDMPREEMSFGENVITSERYKSMIELNLKKGDRNFGYAIAKKETNELVGYTRVLYNKYDLDLVEQDDTGVVHEHRGNGFGLALKYKVLERILNELNAKFWFTGNAQSNKHMIRINKKLKHKIVGKKVVYELKREEWELI